MPQVKIPHYHFPDRSGPKELGTPFRKIVIAQVVKPDASSAETREEFEEISRLVETLDGTVVGNIVQKRPHPHPEFYVGPGKADAIGTLCDQTQADTVVIDGELTPNQISHLEYETGSHVMDRTELILEIFARRARTAEAKIQVELAYLDYVHPRMDRETKVRAYRGGMRGHGESALSNRMRAGRARAQDLRRKLRKLESQREIQQKNRKGAWTTALVGYTNAGKSTLLNALSGEKVYADDRLFATLDTTTRRVFLAEQDHVLMSDTVGFIRRLPHQLVASFRSTLSEALGAELLLHVADASSPTLRHQMETVTETLRELGADGKSVVLCFNKMDATPPEVAEHLRWRYPEAVFLSAQAREGLDTLRERVRGHFVRQGAAGGRREEEMRED